MVRTPSPTVPAIAHASGEKDVIVQLGRYDLGNSVPDNLVNGPEVIVYGDGTAIALIRAVENGSVHRRWVRAGLTEDDLQSLLRAAAELPADPPTVDLAVDDIPTLLVVGARSWDTSPAQYASNDPFRLLIVQLQATIGANIVDDWTPTAWIERPFGATCTVTATLDIEPWYAAPVYPHLVDEYPLGPVSCGP